MFTSPRFELLPTVMNAHQQAVNLWAEENGFCFDDNSLEELKNSGKTLEISYIPPFLIDYGGRPEVEHFKTPLFGLRKYRLGRSGNPTNTFKTKSADLGVSVDKLLRIKNRLVERAVYLGLFPLHDDSSDSQIIITATADSAPEACSARILKLAHEADTKNINGDLQAFQLANKIYHDEPVIQPLTDNQCAALISTIIGNQPRLFP